MKTKILTIISVTLFTTTLFVKIGIGAESNEDKAWRASPIDMEKVKLGKKTFRRKGCKGCHVIGNVKKKSLRGPDLLDVTKRRSKKWLAGWLKDPRKYIKAKDPIIMDLLKKYPTKMPYLKLKDEQVEGLMEYIRHSSAEYHKEHGKK